MSKSSVIMTPALTEDFAWFLGLYYGDGCIDGYRLRITCTIDEPKIMSRLCNTIERLFDYTPKVLSQKSKAVNVRINSRPLVRWFKEQGIYKQKCAHIQVPNLILDANDSIQNAFISGYWDADGTANCSTNSLGRTLNKLSCKSVSFAFINTIQSLLVNRKIHCYTNEESSKQSIYKGKVVNHKKSKTLSIRPYSTEDMFVVINQSSKIQLINKNIKQGSLRLSKVRSSK